MRVEIIISLISAVGLHAGMLCLGGGQQDRPSSAAEIEIGLEAGVDQPSTGTLDENPGLDELPSPADEQPSEEPAPPVPTPVAPEIPEPTPPPEAPADEPPIPAVAAPTAVEEAPPAPVKVPAKATPKASPAPAQRAGAKTAGRTSSGSTGSGSHVSTARYQFRAPLRYPSSAYSRRIGGTVVLTIQINRSGRATDVDVKQSSGNRELDEAAVRCARSSRYEPYRVNGQAEPCSVVAPFRFEPR